MEYMPTLRHSCLESDEMKRSIRMSPLVLQRTQNIATLPSVFCGNFHDYYPNSEQSTSTIIIFNNPSFTPACCVLDLDMYFSKRHLPVLKSIQITEHFSFATHHWLLSDSRQLSNSRVVGMLASKRIKKKFVENFFVRPFIHSWTCSSSTFCTHLGNRPKLHESMSGSVRVTGRPWSINTMTNDNILLKIMPRYKDNTFYSGINVSFRFREWDSVAAPPIIHRTIIDKAKWNVTQASTWELVYVNCFTGYGICYNFYRKQIASWLDGEQFCRSEGKVLLSTPTNYEWEIITTLFARDPYVINLVQISSLAFINLLKNQVGFCGMFRVCR